MLNGPQVRDGTVLQEYLANCIETAKQDEQITTEQRDSLWNPVSYTHLPILNKIDLPSAHPDEVAQEVEDVIGLPCLDAPRVSAKTGLNGIL